MRKITSSNSLNERQINDHCGVAFVISMIGGRWKPTILWQLMGGKLRYSELKSAINNISERVLAAQLRELEKDKIIERTVYPGVPPKVEYEMTTIGKSLQPLLRNLADWGEIYRAKQGITETSKSINQGSLDEKSL